MIQNFEINSNQIDKIKKITTKEKDFRIKNLELFRAAGFPNKRLEDWKFSDFKNIVDRNFDELDTKKVSSDINKIDLIKDFEHNYILLVNGDLHSSNFNYEEKSKIKLNPYDKSINYKISKNPLVCLNHALAENGYSLEIEKNYKFKKVLVIYNFFTKDIKNQILNNKNKIKVNENAELHFIEYTIKESKIRIFSYWKLENFKMVSAKSDYLEEFEYNFLNSVKSRMVSDVPIGSLISGGIDSSALVQTMLDIESNLNLNLFFYEAKIKKFNEKNDVNLFLGNMKSKYPLSKINLHTILQRYCLFDPQTSSLSTDRELTGDNLPK